MTTETWSWRIIDEDTREARRFWNDGATLLAIGGAAPEGFWERHPLVAKVAAEAGTGGSSVRVWMKSLETPEAPATERPGRPADLTFHGPWTTQAGFWAAHPAVEHVEVSQHLDDAAINDAWSAALWLKPAG